MHQPRPTLRTRRSFLRDLALGATVAPWVARGLLAQSPNSVIHHASFGCAGMALSDVGAISKHAAVQIVAGCDVDEKRTVEFRKKFPEARIYSNFRELLEKEKDLQTVNVSTPDHMHAPIAVSALNRGLHVYGQKPLAHHLHEVRRMTEIARAKKLHTQMGIQIHSNSEYRTACHAIQSGTIGKVKEVHTWSSKKWGDNGAMPTKTDPVPEGLDWDLWLGVAEERPFIGGGFYHPGNWRKRLDFGTGTFGDMGCHIYDPVFKALALTAPLSIRSDGAQPNDHSWATDAIIDYVFPGTAFTEGKTVRVVWYDGDQRPPQAIQDAAQFVKGEKGKAMPDQGSIFLGTKGIMILPHIAQPRLVGAEVEGATIEKVPGESHWHQFIETALGNRPKADANWDYAGPLTEAVLLGSVATRFPKQTLAWDAAALKFTNADAANAFVTRTYRKGREVAGL
jgi:predicted dehydrogenase